MTPVFQTKFDADGGNCFTAALASILDMPICLVPDFADWYGDAWEAQAERWLARRGLCFLTVGFADAVTFVNTYWQNAETHCIVSGPSTYPGRGHALVGKVTASGAIEFVHDPMPGQCGLPYGHRWVRFVVGLPPAAPANENGGAR